MQGKLVWVYTDKLLELSLALRGNGVARTAKCFPFLLLGLESFLFATVTMIVL